MKIGDPQAKPRSRTSSSRARATRSLLRIVLPTVGAFAGGLVLGGLRAEATPEQENAYQAVGQLGRVLVQIENNYVDPVERGKLLEGAIKGMVENLDPHSNYLPPEEWKQFQSDTEGKFGGVGLEVDGRSDKLIVIAPIEGSPAARAGIRSGDQIVAIDGVDVMSEPLEKVVKKMRGAPGEKVKITIHRESGRGTAVAGAPDSGIVPSADRDGGAPPTKDGDAGAAERSGQTLTFELTREVIQVSSVTSKLMNEGIGYIRIKQFQERTYDETMAAAAKLREVSKGQLKGVLLDVRSNPGGLVDEATDIADEFLSSGGIYSMRHRGQIIEDLKARSGGAFVTLPVVALVNEWSASASELLVGALQDNRRATVVGVNTFGKGSVQSILPLPNASGLKLTTARYYTPSGHAIQADGIHPDVVVETGRSNADGFPVTREKDLPGHLSAEGPQGGAKARDAGAVVVDGGAETGEVRGLLARDIPVDPSSSQDAVLRIGYQTLLEHVRARSKK